MAPTEHSRQSDHARHGAKQTARCVKRDRSAGLRRRREKLFLSAVRAEGIEIGDDILPFLRIRNARKHHFGVRYNLLR
jgi:hypothetical protein